MSETELRNGRYVLVKRLGEGTQGETFEAVDKRVGRLVAVKRFRVGKAKAWKDVELAEREANTLASLQHELLPHYVEHFEEDGALVLVMERIEGESLAELRSKGSRLSVSDVQRLLVDASSALSYLHGRAPAVIHRDLKPGNVIRRPDGSFAFVDFGAVRDRLKLAGGSTIVGTFGYMAPEQFQGRASAASDVYGIGATALTMLTGCEPEDLPHKGLAIDVAKAVPATTPSSLVRTLEAMLDPDPDKRASSVAEAIERGSAAARGGSSSTRPSTIPSTIPSSPPSPRRSRREAHAGRKAARDADRDARKDARRARRRGWRRDRIGRRMPFPLRVGAWLGLLIARLAVWLGVGIAVPVVLSVLSIVFGEKLRRAAAACRRAAAFAGSAMDRASQRMAGDDADDQDDQEESDGSRGSEDTEDARRVRINDVLHSVRAVTPEQAQREAMRAAERRDPEDAEAWAARRAQEEADRWQPPDAWLEREQREREEREEREQEEEADRERQAEQEKKRARRSR